MAVLSLAVPLLLGGAAKAWEPPRAYDHALLGASIALNAIDMWSSFDIGAWHWVPPAGYYSVDGCVAPSSRCRKEYLRYETNPLLVMAFGPHPTRGQFATAFLIGSGIETVIWLYMPERNRWVVPAIAIVAESVVIYGNFRSGLALHF